MLTTFTIGDVSAATGVPVATLHMWERRVGFPSAARLPSGHRRYNHEDVEAIRRVAADRAAGVTLAAAVERATSRRSAGDSVFAALAREHPGLQPRLLRKPAMTALTHALEDETLARGERAVIFGAFQKERFYRREQARWNALTESATAAFVFADFPRLREDSMPAEVPLDPGAPLAREWAFACRAPGYCACIAAREVARSPADADGRRMFEAVWSVEPEACATALEACASLVVRATGGELAMPRLATPEPSEQLRLATTVCNRALESLGEIA